MAEDPIDTATVPMLTRELDLQGCLYQECATIVDEYLRAAQAAGMDEVRIVHGERASTLRKIAHGILDIHPVVASYSEDDANWGATLVLLKPR